MTPLLRALVAGLFGLLIGSFLTVVADRVPKGESVVAPRSRCPGCGSQLRSIDNIPVISWLLLRGRCHGCGEPISIRYPLLELTTGLVFGAIAFVYARPYWIVLYGAFAAVLIALSAIDLEHRRIPNRITYPATAVLAAMLLAGRLLDEPVDLFRALLGAAIFGGALLLIALVVPRGMGMGDVKLAVPIGLVLGASGLRLVGVAAGAAILFGGLAAVLALLAGRGRKSAMPFGPCLAAGAIVAILWGDRIAGWYLDTLS